jgi:hypothetical protein
VVFLLIASINKQVVMKNDKGPSINDISSKGEGGGTPQKEMNGDIVEETSFLRSLKALRL